MVTSWLEEELELFVEIAGRLADRAEFVGIGGTERRGVGHDRDGRRIVRTVRFGGGWGPVVAGVKVVREVVKPSCSVEID